MIKRKIILSLAIAAAALVSCREKRPDPRPTVPLVLSVASDTAGLGHVAAQAGHIGPDGHIVIFGEKADGLGLVRRFLSVDHRDNIDGRAKRDSLPDFAGETFDLIMDSYNEPYAHFLETQEGRDSLREDAVRGALFAWDSLSRAKIVIFTSSLHEGFGLFDVDTLQQLTGGVSRLMSPVRETLSAAVAKGAENIVVWASASVRDANIYEEAYLGMGYTGNVTVITPDPALDICTEFRSLLRLYRPAGRRIDALILDGYGIDPAPLWSEIALIRRAATQEDEAFAGMLPQDICILEPESCLVDATYALLRRENLFTHRIYRPAVRYFITEESLDGVLQKVPLSAQYVHSEYVSNLN